MIGSTRVAKGTKRLFRSQSFGVKGSVVGVPLTSKSPEEELKLIDQVSAMNEVSLANQIRLNSLEMISDDPDEDDRMNIDNDSDNESEEDENESDEDKESNNIANISSTSATPIVATTTTNDFVSIHLATRFKNMKFNSDERIESGEKSNALPRSCPIDKVNKSETLKHCGVQLFVKTNATGNRTMNIATINSIICQKTNIIFTKLMTLLISFYVLELRKLMRRL